jgi:hypothetical protein
MKPPRLFFRQLGGFLILSLVACTTTTPELASEIKTDPVDSLTDDLPIEITLEIEPAHPTQTTPSDQIDPTAAVTQYNLDVALDYDAKRLAVAEIITYTNNTGTVITDLPIIVPPAYRQNVFILESIVTTPAVPDTQVQMQAAQINLTLNPPLEPGDHITISLDYALILPLGAYALGYTDRQILLADWYPMIPPFLGQGSWLINKPGQVGEHLVYPLSDFHLNLCLAPTTQALNVAASAPLADKVKNCYQYQSTDKRNLSLAISPYYHISTADSDRVTVMTYTFPEHAGLGERAAKLAVKAWETFTDLLGDNQRAFLSIVEADIFDGLETDGMIYISEWYYQTADPSPQNYFALLTVHETAHQWFYGVVHNDQAHHPWLDEALTTYSEALFYEVHHPELVAWWWDYRVSTYAPEGAVNAPIYDFNEYRPYINAVYLRGALFLESLRKEIGDEAFFKGLREYVQRGSGDDHLRQPNDFIDVFSQISEADLSEVLSEYFQ